MYNQPVPCVCASVCVCIRVCVCRCRRRRRRRRSQHTRIGGKVRHRSAAVHARRCCLPLCPAHVLHVRHMFASACVSVRARVCVSLFVHAHARVHARTCERVARRDAGIECYEPSRAHNSKSFALRSSCSEQPSHTHTQTHTRFELRVSRTHEYPFSHATKHGNRSVRSTRVLQSYQDRRREQTVNVVCSRGQYARSVR